MSSSPFFQFYPSDWLAGTRGLTAAETGVYITLIAMMYEAEGPVSNDAKRLARLCGSTPAAFKKALDALIQTGKIKVTDRGLFNGRVEIEIEKRSEKRAAASSSANARWKKTEQNQTSNHANASQTQCVRNANQKPEPEIEEGGGGSAHTREPTEIDQTLRERILAACGADPVSGLTGPNGGVLGTRADMQAVEKWQRDLHLSDEAIVAVVTDAMNRKRDGPPARLSYFDKPMQREAGRASRPALTPIEGGQDVQQPSIHPRQPSADDRLGRVLDAAVRNRAPSRGDFGFG